MAWSHYNIGEISSSRSYDYIKPLWNYPGPGFLHVQVFLAMQGQGTRKTHTVMTLGYIWVNLSLVFYSWNLDSSLSALGLSRPMIILTNHDAWPRINNIISVLFKPVINNMLLPASALMASWMPGGLTTIVSAFAVITAVLSTTFTWQHRKGNGIQFLNYNNNNNRTIIFHCKDANVSYKKIHPCSSGQIPSSGIKILKEHQTI